MGLNVQDIMLNEISHTHKQTLHDLNTCGIFVKVENRTMVVREKGYK